MYCYAYNKLCGDGPNCADSKHPTLGLQGVEAAPVPHNRLKEHERRSTFVRTTHGSITGIAKLRSQHEHTNLTFVRYALLPSTARAAAQMGEGTGPITFCRSIFRYNTQKSAYVNPRIR
jgi:hypothetical protein